METNDLINFCGIIGCEKKLCKLVIHDQSWNRFVRFVFPFNKQLVRISENPPNLDYQRSKQKLLMQSEMTRF